MNTALMTVQKAEIENAHVAYIRDWSVRCGKLALAAMALRKEREQLENELSGESANMVMLLVKNFGYGIADAETRVEQLLEDAFKKDPA